MDIEKLNRTQIVLLTLLTSFVTSIATGIVTVTLMDQAPPVVTNTIHKVVEKTIETVVPDKNTAMVSGKKEIVIIKEQNLIADVVNENSETIVRINKTTEQGNVFAGFGIFVDKSGIIVTDSWNILADNFYSIVLDEKQFNLEPIAVNSDKGVTYLKIIETDDKIFKTLFKEAKIADVNSVKLGQSIIAFGGLEADEIMTGIISGLVKDEITSENNSTTTEDVVATKVISSIKTNIAETGIIGGTPILNLSGEVVGINIDPNSNSFIPLDFVQEDIEGIMSSSEESID